jgi:probable HAF family extracellular repeat protein
VIGAPKSKAMEGFIATARLSVAALYLTMLPHMGARQISYTVFPLSDLFSVAGVNDSGQVVGETVVGETAVPLVTGPNGVGRHPVRGLPFEITHLSRINNQAQVSGNSYDPDDGPGPNHAFISAPDGTPAHEIGTVGTFAEGLNNAGQVTGSFEVSGGLLHAFLTGPNGSGPLKDLGTLPDCTSSFGHAVNDLGQVTGECALASGGLLTRAFLSAPDGGPLKSLGTLGGSSSSGWDVNQTGQVVGISQLPGDQVTHAFVSTENGGRLTDLGSFSFRNSFAAAINDSGAVVGWSELVNGPSHAFLYTRDSGMVDLNRLIDPSLELNLGAAIDINNAGQILVQDYFVGASFLLTPTNINGVSDSGSTGLLLGCVLATLTLFTGRWQRHKSPT